MRPGSLLGYAEDSIALMDALHIDTFSVLGASGGGPFALACTAKNPERVRCCGLLSAIGPLTIPHSMDGMASVNRIFFTLAPFIPALTGVFVPTLELARYVTEHIPGSVIKVIPNAGHAGTYSYADKVMSTLVSY